MKSEIQIREQFEGIHTLTEQMLKSVENKPNIQQFNELFSKRTELFEQVNVSIRVGQETGELIKDILKYDKKIEDILKIFLKALANEQIRLIHANRTIGQKQNLYESYIDFKK